LAGPFVLAFLALASTERNLARGIHMGLLGNLNEKSAKCNPLIINECVPGGVNVWRFKIKVQPAGLVLSQSTQATYVIIFSRHI
jgi:hypothetical protein